MIKKYISLWIVTCLLIAGATQNHNDELKLEDEGQPSGFIAIK